MRQMVGWLLLACLCVLPWTAGAAGVRLNDPVTIVGPVNYGTDAGGDDTYACTLDPALGGAAYVTGACYQCQVATANTGPATINFNAIGAVAITKVAGGVTTALADNDIRAGHHLHVCFDGTQMQCQNCDGNISSATAAGFLPDGTAASLPCGPGTGGQMQLGPNSNLEYCGYETPPLLHFAGTPGGLTWGDTASCAGDENQGKLTVISGVIQCGPDVSDASTAAWNDGGATSLTCGGAAQGQHQVMNTGRVEYCGGEDVAVLYAGYLLPTPLSFNITAATCTGDASGGKLTINGANQVVCASDVVGEGGGGPGDLTAFGSCATGDCATTGSPLTSYWLTGSAAPAAPAAGQGRVFFDQTAKNLAVIADDSALKYGAQVMTGTEHFFLTSFAADGAFASARPSTATLSDGATLVKLTDAQVLTNKHTVDRTCTLAASSGTVAVNANGCDIFERYDVGGTLDLANPTATAPNPRDQQVVTFDLLAAAAQALTWGTAYDDSYGLALPTTLPAGRRIAISFRYNAHSTKYELWSVHDPRAIVSAVLFQGSTSGTVTMQPGAAAAGTYNFNLPTSAGTAGQPLLSAAGAGPHTYGPLNLAGGASIVAGILPNANTTGTSGNVPSSLMARDASGNVSAGIVIAALSGNATTATALAANPAACGAGTFVTDIAANGTLTCATPAGGGTGTMHLFVGSPKLPTTNAAIVDGGGNYYKIGYDETTPWCAWWQIEMPQDYTGSLVFEGTVSPVGSTTGSLILDVAVMAITPGDTATIEADSYDTVNTCTLAAIPTTAGWPGRISCALTNADNAAAEDALRIKVCRNITDTAATRMNLSYAVLHYAR